MDQRRRGRRRRAGLRGRDHRHPGLSGSGRERLQGLPAGFVAGHRRAHGPARQDLPHRRLRHVHSLAQAGGVRAQQEHRDRHAGGRAGNLRRAGQLQGQNSPESALRGSGQVQRLRRLHRGLPGGPAERVRPPPGHAQGDLPPVPAGHPERVRHLEGRGARAVQGILPGRCERAGLRGAGRRRQVQGGLRADPRAVPASGRLRAGVPASLPG
jgi:hypothetical protein